MQKHPVTLLAAVATVLAIAAAFGSTADGVPKARVVSSQVGNVVFMGSRRPTSNAARLVDAYTGLPYAYAAAKFAPAAPYDFVRGPEGSTCKAVKPGSMFFVEGRTPGTACPPMSPTMELPSFLQHILAVPPTAGAVMSAAECRSLDVFVPVGTDPAGAPRPFARPLPVLVFVHGGMNDSGSRLASVNRGEELLRFRGHDYIVVAVEYALGPLGFWHAADTAATGEDPHMPAAPTVSNGALRDVMMALLWVQRAIASFGGDPHNVTLGGHSAGGALAQHAHVALFRGWERWGFAHAPFTRVLSMSGSALMLPAVNTAAAHARQRSLAAHIPRCAPLVWAAEPMSVLTACVATTTDAELVAANIASGAIWTPVVDGTTLHEETGAAIDAGRVAPGVATMFTGTPRETSIYCLGLSQASPTLGKDEHFANIIGQSQEITDAIVEEYFMPDVDEVIGATTGLFMLAPIARSIRGLGAAGHSVGFRMLHASLDRIGPQSTAWALFDSLSHVLVSSVGPLLRRALATLAPSVLSAVDGLAAARSRLDDLSRLGAFHGIDQLMLFNSRILERQDPWLRFGSLATPDDNDLPMHLTLFVTRGILPTDDAPGPYPDVFDRVRLDVALFSLMAWRRSNN